MLEKLFNVLSTINTESLEKMLEKELENLTPMSLERYSNSFVDKGDHYELILKVGNGVDANNINVDFDGNDVTVVYKESCASSKMMVRISESLPEDADDSTLDAFIDNDKLIVSVDKENKF